MFGCCRLAAASASALETLRRPPRWRMASGQDHLQRDHAVQAELPGLIDHPHAARGRFPPATRSLPNGVAEDSATLPRTVPPPDPAAADSAEAFTAWLSRHLRAEARRRPRGKRRAALFGASRRAHGPLFILRSPRLIIVQKQPVPKVTWRTRFILLNTARGSLAAYPLTT